MKIYSLCLPCSKSLIKYAQIEKYLVSIISLGGEKLQINEKPMFIWVLMFFILYHFWAFSRMAHYCYYFFRFSIMHFLWKRFKIRIEKDNREKEKKIKGNSAYFLKYQSIILCCLIDTNKLHYFPTTIWTKVATF